MENGMLKNNFAAPFSNGFKPIFSPYPDKPSAGQSGRIISSSNPPNTQVTLSGQTIFSQSLEQSQAKYRKGPQGPSPTFQSHDVNGMPGLVPKNLDFSAISKNVTAEIPQYISKGPDTNEFANSNTKDYSAVLNTDFSARLELFRPNSTDFQSAAPYLSENSSSVSSPDTLLWTGAASDGEGFSTPPPSGSTSPVSESAVSHSSTSSTKSTSIKSTAQTTGQKRKGTPYIPSYMDLSNGPEPCVVCGDAATGYHYRCMTCEGCKGFFRRTIQKNLTYHCKWSSCCVIDKTTRNQCQQCRYNKCIAVGMATDLVLNDRQRVAKRKLIADNRHKRRQEMTSQATTAHAQCGHDALTHADRALIDDVTKAYEQTTAATDPDEPGRWQGIETVEVSSDAWRELAEGLTPSIVKVVDFAKKVPGFLQLCVEDQILLLKACCMEIMCLRAACRYNPADDTLSLQNGAKITSSQGVTNTELGLLVDPIFELGVSLSKLELDKSEIALLATVLLFQSDRLGLKDAASVEKLQDATLGAFKRYVAGTRPSQPVRWAKVIMKVTDLRSLSTRHAERLLGGRVDGAPGEATPTPPLLLLQVFDERHPRKECTAPHEVRQGDVTDRSAQQSDVTNFSSQQLTDFCARQGDVTNFFAQQGDVMNYSVPQGDVTDFSAQQVDVPDINSRQGDVTNFSGRQAGLVDLNGHHRDVGNICAQQVVATEEKSTLQVGVNDFIRRHGDVTNFFARQSNFMNWSAQKNDVIEMIAQPMTSLTGE